MPDAAPSWLQTMRTITGTLEVEGSTDNPVILAWRDEIARRFPDMASYCAEYAHDSIPWCGLTVAYCMAHNEIRPVFGPDDTDKFLWAQAWKQFGSKVDRPQLGDVLVFARHVTLYDGEDGDFYLCRGGNQSDSVNVTHFRKSGCEAILRPPAAVATGQPRSPTVPISPVRRCAAITATVFGGRDDRNVSAYDEHTITDDELGVALPARFRGARPKVRVSRGNKSVDCDIVDIGPHYDGSSSRPADRYWETGARPRAETDPGTNGAGIDLTPAAARAIALDGKGLVDWEFVGAQAATVERHPPAMSGINELKAAIEAAFRRLRETQMTTISPTVPQQGTAAAPQADLAALSRLLTGLAQLNTTLAGIRPPQAGDPNVPILSPIDKALGGQAMVGLKTPLAILAGAGVWIMQAFGAVGPVTGTATDKASTTAQVLYALIAAFGGLGVTSKLDRGIKALGLIASVLQKLPALTTMLPKSDDGT